MEIVGGTISDAKLVNIIFSAKFFALNFGNNPQKDSGVKWLALTVRMRAADDCACGQSPVSGCHPDVGFAMDCSMFGDFH